jgi:hypothetical protein
MMVPSSSEPAAISTRRTPSSRMELRRLRDRLSAIGVTWMIPLAAGPPDRVELIAETLRS